MIAPRLTEAEAASLNARASEDDADRTRPPITPRPTARPHAGRRRAGKETGRNVRRPQGAASRRSIDPNRPAGTKARYAGRLKLIFGGGPKLEGKLHSLGTFTYAQVAAWNQADATGPTAT